jgi:hypothetical protein
MKNIQKYILGVFIILLFISCSSDKDIDTQKPSIDAEFSNAFPGNYKDTLFFGESFNLRIRFVDNEELGSYSIDLHHNFDHHNHSTEFHVPNNYLDPKKTPVNDFKTIQEFEIPSGQSEFITNQKISLPISNAKGKFDEGDYHFSVSLTDKNGWSTLYGIGIKILYRN